MVDTTLFKPDVSVALTRYNEPDKLISITLGFLANQKNIKVEVLFYDQVESPNIKKACKTMTNDNIVFRYNKIEKRGLSYARNLGIKNALADKLLFLDADALPSDTWAAHMAAALEETVNTPKPTYVAAVSGNIAPLFLPKSGIPSATVRKSNNTGPAWCKSKLVLEMYSALQFPVKRVLLGRMIGASCGVNLKRVGRKLQFDGSLGRNNNLRGGEETKYAATIKDAGFAVIYCDEAKVRHCIPYERQNLKWLFKRTFSQGLDREKKKGMPKPFNDKMSFHDYLWLPFLGIAFGSGWLSSKFS